MTPVGQRERATQDRVVALFTDPLTGLGYEYLGIYKDRVDNSNVEGALLKSFLKETQGYDPDLVDKAVAEVYRVLRDQVRSLYDINRNFYNLLRYGVNVRPDVGEKKKTLSLVDWKHPERNHFALAEEVTIVGKANKRPDIVLYVNGIALGVLELKRSIVSVSEGIRQCLDSQKAEFIQPFFATIQLLMAGNDSQGLRYAAIETPEKYWLTWKEVGTHENPLDRDLVNLCRKDRLLELIHDFIVFDAGTKKTARHNQFFGVQAAQERVRRRQGGIIWHTQGSGKSLTMVWLAKWIRENVPGSRVAIITDRTELDEQIEKVFLGVSEQMKRTKSGGELISWLGAPLPELFCSLIHKFGGKNSGDQVGDADVEGYIAELRRSVPAGFMPYGDLYVFIDECHRTQSGLLHEVMKELLPNAVFIGFTGTPLLARDKKRSIEIFGGYIHTYKYDEAVADGVVLDLRYEARDIDQEITSPAKIDQWFEAKTRGLNDIAKADLKKRWGTMQKVLSSQSRLEKIVADILMDMETRDRFQSGRGNAILVTNRVYEACKCYELFERAGLAGKVAIVTSYKPSPAELKGEETGEGLTEKLQKYAIYRAMLARWFNEPEDSAMTKAEMFEKQAKKKFIQEPGQMKLLIVVDKLLTGFDAPPATYLYIDKKMHDHALFQAICRVNRLDGDDKEYGVVIDYQDLFRSLERSIRDYTSEAFDNFDAEDVEGLLQDRLQAGRERLDAAREAVHALCEPVGLNPDTAAYLRYFLAPADATTDDRLERERRRMELYRLSAAFLRAYAAIANEMLDAGYTVEVIATIKREVEHFEKVRIEVKLASGDYIDLKMYEPAMRHLIDTYIRADESENVSAFDDMSLIELVIQRGPEAINELPDGIRTSEDAVAETIEGNVRRLIIDESPINPRYYEQMSVLLDTLVDQRRQEALTYREYLQEIVD